MQSISQHDFTTIPNLPTLLLSPSTTTTVTTITRALDYALTESGRVVQSYHGDLQR